MANMFENIIHMAGEDSQRDGLKKTPERAAKAFQFLTRGYKQDINALVNDAIFPTQNSELVLVKNIELFSLCEHHLLPFYGKCHVGYIPNGKVIGLSKVARIVDLFARRLQIQEQLTYEIAEAIHEITGATSTGVVIHASHMCMMMRGVEKQHSYSATSSFFGNFKTDPNSKQTFLDQVSAKC
ncbi:MAG: GTP cyclohydrolase I FolE [Gammaproteobacteria bacterium]|nr:GTP cyclohydrolase I FolE [Gammaproteobacteria bacterium]